jgi:2-polyprenyl-3-methyl-5-hydroxy-6-metoxy-1,4-benzoquinol methylase
LGSAFSFAKGKTVIDVGCHDGTVAEAFRDAGAAKIDGCDIFIEGVERARKLVPAGHFVQCDLSKGSDHFKSLGFGAEYDIVCYLGMQHHLSRQMQAEHLNQLVEMLADMAKSMFLLRTPDRYIDSVQDILLAKGFRQHEASAMPGRSKAIIYKR